MNRHPETDGKGRSTRPALARELRAIAVLYLFLAILPVLVGVLFG